MNRSPRPAGEPRYGWVVVAVAFVFLGIGSGSFVSISVFLRPLTDELGWGRGDTTFAYLAGSIALGLGGIAMGHLADRYSTRRVVLAGVVALGLSLLLLGRQDSLWQFYLLYCLLGGLGAGAFQVPLLTNIGYWFDRRKGLALGIASAGLVLGNGAVSFLARYLITVFGWRGAYTILGVLALAALAPLVLLVRAPPPLAPARDAPASRDAPLGGAVSTAPASSVSSAMPARVIVPWLSVAIGLGNFCSATALVHVVALAQDRGIAAQAAAGIVLVIFVASFVGRVTFGAVADRVGGLRAALIAFAAEAALVFWFTQLTSVGAFYVLAAVFGLGYSGVVTCLVVCVRELTPVHRQGASQGVILFFGWLGHGLGGYVSGVLFDVTGAYVVSYAGATLAGALGLLALIALLVYGARQGGAIPAYRRVP